MPELSWLQAEAVGLQRRAHIQHSYYRWLSKMPHLCESLKGAGKASHLGGEVGYLGTQLVFKELDSGQSGAVGR